MTKQEIKTKFEERMATIISVLNMCKINPVGVQKWVRSPAKINEFRTLLKWVDNELAGPVNTYIRVRQLKTDEEWDNLKAISNAHQDIKYLEEKAKTIRKVWHDRPRIRKMG